MPCHLPGLITDIAIALSLTFAEARGFRLRSEYRSFSSPVPFDLVSPLRPGPQRRACGPRFTRDQLFVQRLCSALALSVSSAGLVLNVFVNKNCFNPMLIFSQICFLKNSGGGLHAGPSLLQWHRLPVLHFFLSRLLVD